MSENPVDKTFRKQEQAAEGLKAWQEELERPELLRQRTALLREQRAARDAVALSPPEKKKKKERSKPKAK